MSRIAGIWNLDGRPVEGSLLEKVGGAMAHPGLEDARSWIRGGVGLSCRLFKCMPESGEEVQPLEDASGVVLVFDGRLDNREELLSALRGGHDVSSRSPDPEIVLAAYLEDGDRFPESLNGDFALALFDPRRPRLVLARDAIGLRALYYRHAGSTFLFASEINGLLAHPDVSIRPDDEMLAGFIFGGLGLGYQDRTFFRGLHCLPPAHAAVLTPEGLALRKYWDFDPAGSVRLGAFADCAEAFRFHFETAVRRRMRSAYPVGVSISGGLDSSAILCFGETIRRSDPDRHPAVLGVSYSTADGSSSDERRFIEEIERSLQLAVDFVPIGAPSGLLDNFWTGVRQVEMPWLEYGCDHTRIFMETVVRKGVRVLLSGHWGDQVLFDWSYLFSRARRFAWRSLRSEFEEVSSWFADVDPRLFRKTFLRALVQASLPESAVALIRRAKNRIPGRAGSGALYTREFRENVVGPARSRSFQAGNFSTSHGRELYRDLRGRTNTLVLEWNYKRYAEFGLETALPFLDRDLNSFIMGVPGEILTWRGMPKALLREGGRGIIPEAVLNRRSKGDFTHISNNEMDVLFPEILRFLGSRPRAAALGYVDASALGPALGRSRAMLKQPHIRGGRIFRNLLMLELWLRIYFPE